MDLTVKMDLTLTATLSALTSQEIQHIVSAAVRAGFAQNNMTVEIAKMSVYYTGQFKGPVAT